VPPDADGSQRKNYSPDRDHDLAAKLWQRALGIFVEIVFGWF
jgi:hypothetical protein